MTAKTRLVTTRTSTGKVPPRWRVGPRIWRVNGQWRIRLHRPWRRERMLEASSESLAVATCVIAEGAGWLR